MENVITKDEALELIAKNVWSHMERKGIGVRELARSAETNAMTVSRLVNSVAMPTADTLKRIAEVLGVTLDSLFQKK